jgi:hypothetical protein
MLSHIYLKRSRFLLDLVENKVLSIINLVPLGSIILTFLEPSIKFVEHDIVFIFAFIILIFEKYCLLLRCRGRTN